MGQVCRRHEEFYEGEICRWCEPTKAVEAHAAAPPVPLATAPLCQSRPLTCIHVAVWRWIPVTGEAFRFNRGCELFLCQVHQNQTNLKRFFDLGWQTEKLP